MSEELRKFIVDNHEAVNIGDLERTVSPEVSADFPESAVREADELTAHLHQHHRCWRQSMGTAPGGRGLARH